MPVLGWCSLGRALRCSALLGFSELPVCPLPGDISHPEFCSQSRGLGTLFSVSVCGRAQGMSLLTANLQAFRCRANTVAFGSRGQAAEL